MRRGRKAAWVRFVAGWLVILMGCSGKPNHFEVMHDEKREALNYMASLKGVESIKMSNDYIEAEKQKMPLSNVNLPDDYQEYADATVKLQDGSVVHIEMMDVFGLVGEFAEDDYQWKTKGLKTALVGFEAPPAEGDTTLKTGGKTLDLMPDDSAQQKIVKQWARTHRGKTLSMVSFTNSAGHHMMLRLTRNDLSAYRKWEKKKAKMLI